MSAFDGPYFPAHAILDDFLLRIEDGSNPESAMDAMNIKLRGIIRKMPKAPEGFRLTGETRWVLSDEWALMDNGAWKCPSGSSGFFKAPILIPDNVYGKPLAEVEAAEGWVKTGEFRVPVQWEHHIGIFGKTIQRMGCDPSGPDPRRLIVRKLVRLESSVNSSRSQNRTVEPSKPKMTNAGDRMERERQDIAVAASKITDLWWTRPDKGDGHLKTQAVIDILQKQFWGFTDAETRT